MRRLEEDNQCIFCPPTLDNPRHGVIVRRMARWVIRQNAYPYRGTRLHLLLVPREHIADLLDLDRDALDEFWDAARWIRQTYRLTFYGLGARCGDCAYTGGTIVHAHVHFIVGDVDAPDHTPVRLKLSSRPDAS
jgi:ATP adenylyltransferase